MSVWKPRKNPPLSPVIKLFTTGHSGKAGYFCLKEWRVAGLRSRVCSRVSSLGHEIVVSAFVYNRVASFCFQFACLSQIVGIRWVLLPQGIYRSSLREWKTFMSIVCLVLGGNLFYSKEIKLVFLHLPHVGCRRRYQCIYLFIFYFFAC